MTFVCKGNILSTYNFFFFFFGLLIWFSLVLVCTALKIVCCGQKDIVEWYSFHIISIIVKYPDSFDSILPTVSKKILSFSSQVI